MKNEILNLMKEQMHTVADTLTFENYKEMESQIHRIFVMLESAETMLEPIVNDTPEVVTEEAPQEEVTIEEVGDEKEDSSTVDELLKEEDTQDEDILIPTDVRKKYQFERKIKGGVLSEINAFVPETAVRELDLTDGDYVYATFLQQPPKGPAHYEFEIAERSGDSRAPENLNEIEMGIVKERMDGTYYIDRTINEDYILLDGEPATFEISPEDARSLRLKDEDIVNAAYYTNNPQSLRVRWRYQTEQMESNGNAPKPSSHYKKKSTEPKKETEQVFAGKTICAIGFVPGHPSYAEEVEGRGGTFVGLSGKEAESTLSATVGKSDAVIMNLKHVSHAATQWTVPFCKERNIPYTSITNFGRSSFVDAALNLFGK